VGRGESTANERGLQDLLEDAADEGEQKSDSITSSEGSVQPGATCLYQLCDDEPLGKDHRDALNRPGAAFYCSVQHFEMQRAANEMERIKCKTASCTSFINGEPGSKNGQKRLYCTDACRLQLGQAHGFDPEVSAIAASGKPSLVGRSMRNGTVHAECHSRRVDPG
jgi:hypothetical protein